jgi:hypothetical protein
MWEDTPNPRKKKQKTGHSLDINEGRQHSSSTQARAAALELNADLQQLCQRKQATEALALYNNPHHAAVLDQYHAAIVVNACVRCSVERSVSLPTPAAVFPRPPSTADLKHACGPITYLSSATSLTAAVITATRVATLKVRGGLISEGNARPLTMNSVTMLMASHNTEDSWWSDQ